MSAVEGIRSLLRPVLDNHGVFEVDIVLRGRHNNQVLEVFVDSEGVLNAETLENVSKDISLLLDTHDVVRGRYQLVVSSPGVNRPLKSPLQYRKNVGRKLRLIYHDAAGDRTIEGTLVTCSPESIEIRTVTDVSVAVVFRDIVEARVLLPW